jgi:hypothetical protein
MSTKRQGLNDRIERPADVLFQPSNISEEEKNDETLVRATYYLTPEIQECIRIMSFKNNEQKSVLVRNLLNSIIPDEIKEEAKNNLKEK